MLQNLDVSDETLENYIDESVYRMNRRILMPNASKCENGDVVAVYDKLSSVTIWERTQLDGKLCTYDDIEDTSL